MNRDRVLIEMTKLRPDWPTHSIIAVLDHPQSASIISDPRPRSVDHAEQLVRMWTREPVV